ncbi:uncharacterized protein BJ171DRAFT_211350 [Polychytrium aggregatum]|uniref:uncharacterized protein n=1 Tax=Polychytrium aggregatum TaxID=110093 RepID=UPI0022FEFA2B|nr:uncharacterized protein BJ171DRAFT_211350 [Polychytrium aggregatum]KAI9208633.1 hypothetical protein BJ171DRAFT_211350 [Polychytrium aggregatum]
MSRSPTMISHALAVGTLMVAIGLLRGIHAVPYSPKSLDLFLPGHPWNTKVDSIPKSNQSDAIINWLSSNGGWGMGNTLRIDFSISLLTADKSTPFLSWKTTDDWYSPDCDLGSFPVPAGGALEGESGYVCAHDGDCHLLVHDPAHMRLYEMWRANYASEPSKFQGGCLAIWKLDRVYGPHLRGQDCTSADAGGFPIAAMLFSADEVASGTIAHAIRFILPNQRIRRLVYALPGTHSTSATSATNPNAPPYGVHFRLKKSFDMTRLKSSGARVVAKALQTYGMFLADGGNMALTAANDQFSVKKWTDVGIDSYALAPIQVGDFEVVNLSPANTVHYAENCVRSSI